MDADLLHRLVVFAGDVLAKDQIRIGGAMQPAIMLNLVFELARSPARIAKRKYRAARPVAARNCLEDVEGRGQADPVVDWQRGILNDEVAGVQHKSTLRVDRTALE